MLQKKLLARKPQRKPPRSVLPKRLLARKQQKRLPRNVLQKKLVVKQRKKHARKLKPTVRLPLQLIVVWLAHSVVATRETAATQQAMAHKVHPMVTATRVPPQEQVV